MKKKKLESIRACCALFRALVRYISSVSRANGSVVIRSAREKKPKTKRGAVERERERERELKKVLFVWKILGARRKRRREREEQGKRREPRRVFSRANAGPRHSEAQRRRRIIQVNCGAIAVYIRRVYIADIALQSISCVLVYIYMHIYVYIQTHTHTHTRAESRRERRSSSFFRSRAGAIRRRRFNPRRVARSAFSLYFAYYCCFITALARP